MTRRSSPGCRPGRSGIARCGLAERELAVLALMAEGRSNQAIASQLYMSPKTVETHIGNMLAKLGLRPQRRTTAGCLRS